VDRDPSPTRIPLFFVKNRLFWPYFCIFPKIFYFFRDFFEEYVPVALGCDRLVVSHC